MPRQSSTIATSTDRGQVNCVIVEDQTMFLELLASMITLRGGIRIAGRARDVAEGAAACRKHRPDVLILDLALPDGDGLEVARQFVAANPAGRVLVVSGQASDFICPGWLHDNLHAVISKNDAFDSLRSELDELVGVESPRPEPGDAAALTEREAEVFRLIGDGLGTREIAARLALSEHTVHTHRKRIAVKLGTTGDDLTRRAVAHRIMILKGDGGRFVGG
jgi:DNA-binding NarL/FixJ family response regulator